MRARMIVCIILAVLSLFMLIGGGVLFGCAEMLAPFNPSILSAILVVVGLFGTIGFTIGSVFAGIDWR